MQPTPWNRRRASRAQTYWVVQTNIRRRAMRAHNLTFYSHILHPEKRREILLGTCHALYTPKSYIEVEHVLQRHLRGYQVERAADCSWHVQLLQKNR